MLDRTADAETSTATAVENQNESAGLVEATARHDGGIRAWLARGWQFFITQSSSSLTRRIVVLNITGLVALSIGIIVLSQFRAGLIDARIQSLLVQSEIIAGAIASSATVETDSSITLDPDKLLNLHPGESYGPNEDALYGLDFPINPERVGPILRRLVSPTKTRARIYDRDGVLLVDSRNLFGRGDILRYDLPPPRAEQVAAVHQQHAVAIIDARARLGWRNQPPQDRSDALGIDRKIETIQRVLVRTVAFARMQIEKLVRIECDR